MTIYRLTYTLDHDVEVIPANASTKEVGGYAGLIDDAMPKPAELLYRTKPKRHAFDVLPMGGGMAFSERAMEAILKTDTRNFRSIKITINGNPWSCLDVVRVFDVLDFEKSDFEMIGSLASAIIKPIFRISLPSEPALFDILGPGRLGVLPAKHCRFSSVFCNQAACDLLSSAQIAGLSIDSKLHKFG